MQSVSPRASLTKTRPTVGRAWTKAWLRAGGGWTGSEWAPSLRSPHSPRSKLCLIDHSLYSRSAHWCHFHSTFSGVVSGGSTRVRLPCALARSEFWCVWTTAGDSEHTILTTHDILVRPVSESLVILCFRLTGPQPRKIRSKQNYWYIAGRRPWEISIHSQVPLLFPLTASCLGESAESKLGLGRRMLQCGEQLIHSQYSALIALDHDFTQMR